MAIDGSKEKTSLRPSIDTSILPYRPQIFTYDQIHYTSGGAPVQKQGFAPHGGRTQQIAGCRSIFLRVAPHRRRTQQQTYERRTDHRRACCFCCQNQSYRLIAFTACKWGIPLCILYKSVHIYFMIFVQYMCTFIVEICVHIWYNISMKGGHRKREVLQDFPNSNPSTYYERSY